MDLIKVPEIDLSWTSPPKETSGEPAPVQYGITQAAKATQANLVGRLRLIQRVTALNMATAVALGQEAKRWSKSVEEARVAVKAKPLALCNAIDQLARDLTASVTSEANRIDRAITVERKRQADEALEAERKAKEEAAEKIRQADRVRQNAELAAQKIADPVKAQQILDLGAASAKTIEAKALTPVAVMPPKVSGLVETEVPKYKVTDIWELAKHDRNLVRIEVAAGAVLTKIREGMKECPGLEIWFEKESRTSGR